MAAEVSLISIYPVTKVFSKMPRHRGPIRHSQTWVERLVGAPIVRPLPPRNTNLKCSEWPLRPPRHGPTHPCSHVALPDDVKAHASYDVTVMWEATYERNVFCCSSAACDVLKSCPSSFRLSRKRGPSGSE